jgi:hypothetical protein
MPREKAEVSEPKKRRIRDIPGRIIARSPWLRRRYAKRMVKMFKKSREKGQRLSGNLALIEKRTRHLPPAKQAEVLEEMLELSSKSDTPMSRELRRATERQERQSGRGRGGVRPGLAPGQRKR